MLDGERLSGAWAMHFVVGGPGVGISQISLIPLDLRVVVPSSLPTTSSLFPPPPSSLLLSPISSHLGPSSRTLRSDRYQVPSWCGIGTPTTQPLHGSLQKKPLVSCCSAREQKGMCILNNHSSLADARSDRWDKNQQLRLNQSISTV